MEPYHTGIVVASLDVAMHDMGRDLGLRWTPVREAVLAACTPGGPADIPMRVVSSDAPMSIELIEQVPDTVFERATSEWHHVAFRTTDLARDVDRLEHAGYRRELWGRNDRGDLTYFCYLVSSSAPRVELVGARGDRRIGDG